MKTKQIFLPLLFLLTTSITFAQGSGSNKGDKHFNKLAYAEAIEVYLNDVNKARTSPILYRNLADSYYNNAMLTKAVKWYKKYTETTEGKVKPKHMFRYAQALKAYKNYKASDQWMNKFYKEVPEDSRGQYYVDNKSYLSKIEFNSGRHTIKNVKFNTSAPEFAPAYLGENEILFSSVRDTSGVRSFDHMWTKSGFTDIFSTPISEDEFVNEKQKALGIESDSMIFKEYSKVTKKDSLVIKHYSKVAKSDSSVKSEVKKIGKKVNSKYNESTAIVSKDGATMYFTRNNYTNKKYRTDDEGVNRLKLYTSKLVDGVWGNIEELPFNSNDYSVAHPALNVDEKRLYFASDMPGSLGMSDIFYVNVLGENSYGEPINLGEKVNTEGRETYPFISDKGRLYIASDGHVGLGGLDVFEVKQNIQGSITKVRNVGDPINSSMDDFAYIINETNSTGYFTSNRSTGKGSDDIYSFTKLAQYLKGNVINETTNEIVPNATIIFKDSQGEVLDSIYTDSKGNYRTEISPNTQYILSATKENYSIDNDSLQSTDEANKEFIRDFVINEVIDEHALCANGINHNPKGLCPICATQHSSDKPYYMVNGIKYYPKVNKEARKNNKYLIEPIYFNLDKDYIRKGAISKLENVIKLMKENSKLMIEVHSFCDSRNSGNYNDDLSTRRAKQTIEYIITRGINPSRINGKAFGELGLVNDCGDGVDCPESKHDMNRRSEFIIISE
ncbi:MAG: hypothetical protein COA88_00045 [Kordia sp.]|nr:MAG: hypothetical protein COA88_00045 [Kordia sp.]